MATDTRVLGDFIEASVSYTYNDVNGQINNVTWIVHSGHLVGSISKTGQPDIPFNFTTSGSTNPPAGYDLVRTARGTWAFAGDITYQLTWHE